MTLHVHCRKTPDPDGHNPALLLKGDWVLVEITDGHHTGRGEASHSKDDDRCIATIHYLFETYVRNIDLSLTSIRDLERGPFAEAHDFVEATAISGINQALYELLAKCENIPVWKLFSFASYREIIPVYATINRALTNRTYNDYRKTVVRAIEQGFKAIKCAPFELVSQDGDQIHQSEYGISVLEFLRGQFPALSIRVDCHERFQLDALLGILPYVEAISPRWLEAPIPIGPDYARLRDSCHSELALGELFFGPSKFKNIVENRWAEVIMPDVKHVGGFGTLMDIVRYSEGRNQVSPHNPSGPISTIASAQAGLISNSVTSLEIPLIMDPSRAYYLKWLDDGCLRVPTGDGWGLDTFFSEPEKTR